MSKTNSRINIVPPYFKGSLFVPTLLSLALISAFSSSALANSGGSWSAEKTAYSKWDTLTGNNIVIDETLSGNVYGAYTEEDNQVVSGNTVTVSAPVTVYGEVIGGSIKAGDGESIGNENAVIVSDGSTVSGAASGGRVETNSDGNATSQADKNTVTISAESTVNQVFGGHSNAATQNGTASADANDNLVTISKSTVGQDVFGGKVFASSDNGNATSRANRNTVTINGQATLDKPAVGTMVAGGYSDASASNGDALAEANNNTVTISQSVIGSENLPVIVYGGYASADTALANNNIVTVSSSKIDGYVYGGGANVYGDGTASAYANKNTIVVSDGAVITNYIYGGYAYIEVDSGNNSAQANDNTVTVSHSTVEDYVHGGRAIGENSTAITNNNSVTISSSEIYRNVYGGRADAITGKGHAIAVANNNTVTVSSSYKYDSGVRIHGGRIDVKVHGEKGIADAEANNNIVTILNSSVDNVYGSRVNAEIFEGAIANLSANENTVVISDKANIFEDVYGGYVDADVDYGNTTALVNKNTVTISNNSTVEGLETGANYGGIVYANENTVVISDKANIFEDVYGGYAYAYAPDSGASTAYANNNTVTISNSKVSGFVYGGYVDAWNGNTNIEQASYNTVIIDSAEVLGNRIAGGVVFVDDSTDSHTATYNTVNIGGAYAIEEVSLYGAYVDSADDPSVNDDLFTGNTLNLDASLKTGTTTVGQVANFETINIKVGDVTNGAIILNAKGGAILGDGNSKGTTVNLLSVDTGNLDAGNYITLISNATGDLANEGQKQFVPIGNSIALGYIGQTNLETDGVVFNIEGKGVTPKTKVLNESRAAEMAFLNSAADLLQDQDIHKAGKHVFGAVRGIYNKYKTGSSVDISGMGLVTGVANTWAGDSSDLTGAVFVEAGWGSFDTKNDIMGSVQRGDGDSYYYGTGLIGKYDVTQGLFSGLYAEAAAHVGIISTDYSNAGLTTLNGVKASYDTDSLYYAAHATAGYRWNVTEKFDLDLSATYLWNYLESQEVKIAADKFDFDSVQSHRMRLAAEVGYTGDKGFRPYAGVAWEREFDGEAGGSVAGYRIEEADLGGNSGLAWAGVTFEPKEGGPVKADAEITTYFGQRKGVSGRVWVRYEF